LSRTAFSVAATRRVCGAGVLVDAGDGVGEQRASVTAEDLLGEELVESVDEGGLVDPEAGGVAVRDGLVLLRRARVVGVGAAGLAEHPSPTEGAEQVRAQQVAAFGVRVGVWSGRGA